jgi:hypothetical protein
MILTQNELSMTKNDIKIYFQAIREGDQMCRGKIIYCGYTGT